MCKRAVRLLIVAVIVIILIWTVWGNITVGVTHYTVSSDRVPTAFDNYKIAVISDLHNAEFGHNNSRLIALIEKEKPDIVAITGDLVDSRKTDIETADRLLQRLAGIAPCYYVPGNHEARIDEQYRDLDKKLLENGVINLGDKVLNLKKNNETIQLAGLNDPDFTDYEASVQEGILKTSLDNMELGDKYCVLLSHRPETFQLYVSEGIDLVLSGHTHGGQVRLPFLGGLIAPHQGIFPKYDAGRYSESKTTMIVSRGIGNSVFPVRFNNRPELVIVELQKKSFQSSQ